jgi:acyl-CoA thioesterase-2
LTAAAEPAAAARELWLTKEADMGDLAVDTTVEKRGDRYVARFSRDWQIWGPNGGYVASIALRAAGAASRFERPASCSVHYLGVAEFDEVELEVKVLKSAKRAESLRVSMTRGQSPILEALVWTVDGALDGLEHNETEMPAVPRPSELPNLAELGPDVRRPPFMNNFVAKPIDWTPWPPAYPLPAMVRQWYRYAPTPTFRDPFVDAARSLILIDTLQWPAAARPHAYRRMGYFAPTIDLSVNFHRLEPDQDWLLCMAEAPVARQGLIGGRASVWTEQGLLLASGGGHLLCRPA